jgi:hypothetical protein
MLRVEAMDLLVMTLGTWQIVEILHHGKLFADRRAIAEVRDSPVDRLFLCPFCLSPWVALAVLLVWLMPVRGVAPTLPHDPLALLASIFLFIGVATWLGAAFVGKAAVLAMAVSRAANLASDATHFFSRTPDPGRDAAEGSSDEATPQAGG